MKQFYQCLLVCGLFLLLSTTRVSAQDIHFSQNYASPLLLNPAMTGMMKGDVRVSAIYRNQWASISPDAPLRTIGLSGDLAFPGLLERDRAAVGLMLYTDKGGDISYGTNNIDLSLGYNLGISSNMFLSVGLSGGVSQRSFDMSKVIFEDMYDVDSGTATGSSLDMGIDATNKWKMNLAGGALFSYFVNHRTNFYLGGGMFHLTRPDFALYESDLLTGLFNKLSLQVGGSIGIKERFDIVPSMYFLKQGPSTKADVGSFFRFIFSSNNRYEMDKAFNLGTWVRMGNDVDGGMNVNALVFTGKLDYDNISIGLSYDWTLGKLADYNNGRGGVEIALIYVGRSRQQKSGELYCPRF